jgi:hypothetical protein
MAIVTGLKAERMLAIEAESVNSGIVDTDGNLILTRHDGTEIDAGHVKGDKGDNAVAYFQVTDTPTIDLTLAGDGTQLSPWNFQADLKVNAVEKTTLKVGNYDSASRGWYVLGADGITYGPYRADSSYFPARGDDVYVKKMANTYVIAGMIDPWIPLISTAVGTVRQYNEINADNQWNTFDYTVRNGFTSLRGLLSLASGGVQLIGVLPPEARPDTTIIVKVNNSDVIRSLYIQADGQMFTASNAAANGYFSLDGVVFPAAGKATWTYVGDPGSGLAFVNGWTHFSGGTTQYGKVGFWKDEFDYVWMTGLTGGGSITANAQMIQITNPLFLPWNGTPTPSAGGTGEQHIMTVSSEVAGVLNIIGGTTNAIRASAVTNASWVSLAGVSYQSTASATSSEWLEHPVPRGMRGGWVNYALGYPTFAFRQRADGLMTTKGLIKSGTLTAIDWIPDGFRSERSMLMSNVANAAYCRFDIAGRQQTASIGGFGMINLVSGSNTWFGFDGAHWFR